MLSSLIFGVLASETGGGTLLDINPGLIIWTIITFVILLLILKKVAWKPILAALEQRENAIKEALEKAERAKQEAQKLLEQNQANLAKAEEEGKKLLDQSREYAEKLKEQILQSSKQQADKIIADAVSEIERKKNSAFNELKAQVAEIAIQAAEGILKENLDKEKQSKIVNRYIGELN